MNIAKKAFPQEIRGFCFVLAFATAATVALLLIEAFFPEFFNPLLVYSAFVALSFIALSIACPPLFKGGIRSSAKTGLNVTNILVVGAGIYFAVYTFVMTPLGIGHFYIVAYVLIVLALSMLIKAPAANCAVVGVFLLNQESFFTIVPLAFAAGVAFTALLVMFAAIRERLIIDDVVQDRFDGAPLAVAVALLMAMVFYGLSALF